MSIWTERKSEKIECFCEFESGLEVDVWKKHHECWLVDAKVGGNDLFLYVYQSFLVKGIKTLEDAKDHAEEINRRFEDFITQKAKEIEKRNYKEKVLP